MTNHPIKIWRKRRGLTQVEAAKIFGISQSHLAGIETGNPSISLVLAGTIVEATSGEVSFEDLNRQAQNSPRRRTANPGETNGSER